MSWRNYALVEFRHSFKAPGRLVPGGRDFLSLTAVFTLLIAIVAISSALQRGMIVNFADSLIGYAEGAGVPIRVALSPGVASNIEAGVIAAQFRNSASIGGPGQPDPESGLAAYEYHPFVEVEASSVVFLPDKAWDAAKQAGAVEGGRVRGFYGWATASDSPLWRWVGEAVDAMPRFGSIVLSRAIFRDHFVRDAYVEAMSAIAPAPMMEDWVRDNPPGEELRTLILQVPYTAQTAEGRGKFKTPYRTQIFQIAWVDSFPAVQRIAFLLPLEMFRVLDRASRATFFRFLPETIGSSRDDSLARAAYAPGKGLVGSIRIGNADLHVETEAARDTFVACLGQGARLSEKSSEFDLLVELSAPVRTVDAERCLQRSAIVAGRDLAMGRAFVTPLWYADGGLRFACRDVDFANVPIPEFEPCRSGATDAPLPIFTEPNIGFVYAPEREAIANLVDAIATSRVLDYVPTKAGDAAKGEAVYRQLLQISELYQNSIDRLNYLVKVVDYLVVPAAIFFGAIVIYLIFIQVYVFLSKRKRNYGVLMARGMGWLEIYKIIVAQFAASLVIGALLALVLLLGSKQILHWSFSGSEAYDLGLTSLGMKEPALLDRVMVDGLSAFARSFTFSAQDLVFGFVVVCLMVFPVLLVSVWRLPIRPRTAPMELISI